MCQRAILAHGSEVTLGSGRDGGDSRILQPQFKNVQSFQVNDSAFDETGSDSSSVHRLTNIREIHAADEAFAANVDEGTVVTCGACRRHEMGWEGKGQGGDGGWGAGCWAEGRELRGPRPDHG